MTSDMIPELFTFQIGDLQIHIPTDRSIRFSQFVAEDPTLRALSILESRILDFRALLAGGHEVNSTLAALDAMHEDRMVYTTNALEVINEWLTEDLQDNP